MGWKTNNAELLQEMARHQTWANTLHWKSLHENAALLEDPEIRKRLNHMLTAQRRLIGMARGETPDPSGLKEIDALDQLEAAMAKANAEVIESLQTVDLEKMISLPRGPQGPFQAPAGALLLQAITHSQHHRGQNASRMRQLGANPPMTDFIIWYALGQP
jgi:uncharacterized damage-inducible protein DinB